VAPPWELPRPQRRFSGIMQNALVTALVSAIVSGVISFAVAHYQSQDAAAQARNAQRITGLTQLESATAGFYQAALALYNARPANAWGRRKRNRVARRPSRISIMLTACLKPRSPMSRAGQLSIS
jgi:hypothetical protein